jgi:sortase A
VRRCIHFVVCVAALVALYTAFEYGVSDVMYSRRQSNLSADFESSRPSLASGTAVAHLQIRTLGTDTYVVENDSLASLRGGPAHRSDTPLPGQPGNSIIVGHHNRYGAPLDGIERLRVGDHIVTTARGGRPVTFTVAAAERTSGLASTLFAASTDARLTIATGHGGRLSSDLYVVQAVVDAKAPAILSAPVGLKRAQGGYVGAMVVANVAFIGAVAAYAWMRKRYGRLLVLVVIAPLVVLSLVSLLLFTEQLLPAFG